MGIGASMLWWEEGFCRTLADGGRFVIRYDHRDTGRSVTYEPGRPEYTGADLVADAVGVLDAFGIPAAHLVGVSAGGAFAQLLALSFSAESVRTPLSMRSRRAADGGGRSPKGRLRASEVRSCSLLFSARTAPRPLASQPAANLGSATASTRRGSPT
jgi:pimeloyl-ACP methyl ester carboxylesterase